MQFNPATHTKEFLLANSNTALELAKNSAEFAVSVFANDFDVLRLADEYGQNVAHALARHQSEWAITEIAQNLDVLTLAEQNGYSVAHTLAAHQAQWLQSRAAQNLDVLRITDKYGFSVAHTLAWQQPEWIKSEAVKNQDILCLSNRDGSVAHMLVSHNNDSINLEFMMQKRILTIEHKGKILAQAIAEKYKSEGFDVPFMAMKLIFQGAAYKNSDPIELDVGEAIWNQCKTLIEDGLDPLISFKQLQALYSTFSHNVIKIISSQEHKSVQQWQELLIQYEYLIRQHLDKHPGLYDIDHTVDIFCEPSDELLKKLQAERILNSNLTSFDELNAVGNSELVPNSQSLY
jgi:hypothetical protein